MHADKFREYMERTVSSGESGIGRMREALCEKESLAWELHHAAAPAGSALLGDLLIRNRISYCNRELKAVPFARELLKQAFASLTALEKKGEWDWYWLGVCHERGRGTPVNHKTAVDCFGHAREAGNPYAHYEEIWAAYLSGTPIVETVFRFRYCSGPLHQFAELSARALALLEMGPPRQIGSDGHVCRIYEISSLLREFYFHDAAHHHINVRVEKEMAGDVDALKAIESPSAALALYLIATKSRSNPTGKEPDAWLRGAIHPDNEALLPITKREILGEEKLQLIVRVCKENGWAESKICRFASWALSHPDGEDEGEREWFP